MCGFIYPQIIPCTIIETQPEAICAGDTLEVRFIVNAPISLTQTFDAAIRLDKNGSTIIDTLYSGTLYNLTVVDTLGIALVYGVKFRVPVQCPAGTWFASGNIQSPNQVSVYVNHCLIIPVIISYTPDSLCVGDTICIKVYNPDKNSFYFNMECNNGPAPVLTWFEVNTAGDEADTVIYCFVVSDKIITCGPGWIGIDLVNQFPIYYKCDCLWDGIQKTEFNELPPTYTNIYGVKTEFQFNAILIEKRGISRRKVVIID